MVRGYNADTWASSSVALPTGSLLSQANRCRWVHWSLEERSKARNTVTNHIISYRVAIHLLP